MLLGQSLDFLWPAASLLFILCDGMHQGVEEGLSASSCSALFLPGKTQKTSTGTGSLCSGHFQILSEKESLGRCMGLGNKGGGKLPGTDRIPSAPLQPRLPGCHPHASSLPGCTAVSWCWKSLPSLGSCRPGSAALGQVCAWLPTRSHCPQRWDSIGCHQQGLTSGAPRVSGLSCTSLSA